MRVRKEGMGMGGVEERERTTKKGKKKENGRGGRC